LGDYVLEYSGQPLQLPFASGPLTVEIGFGMGDSLRQMARDNPDMNFLGIEVHRPGIGKLLHGIAEDQLENLRIVCHDAIEVLRDGLGASSIDRILILFPDPWHKKRHHKRRLIQPDFARLLTSRLRPGGELHLATDWEPYAEHMLEVLEAEPGLENVNGAGEFWQQPLRPETKFERRGEKLGHDVHDLLYCKIT